MLGVAALVVWASLVAVARSVQTEMGVLPAAAIANLVGGVLALITAARRLAIQRMLGGPRLYLLGCGALFVIYNLGLYPAIELAHSDAQTVEIGLINYLWPALVVAFSVPILGRRAGPLLGPGLLIGFAGVCLATTRGNVSLAGFGANISENPRPYLLALMAAVSWGLYSNLSARWARPTDESAVPLFLFATGMALGVVHALHGGGWRMPGTARGWFELGYLTLLPTWLAYLFWDIAMRRGNTVPLGILSFFVPLVSTAISCWYLHVPMGGELLAGAGLIIVGAWLCTRAIRAAGRAA